MFFINLYSVKFELNNGKRCNGSFVFDNESELENFLKNDFFEETGFSKSFKTFDQNFLNTFVAKENVSSFSVEFIKKISIISFDEFLKLDSSFLKDFFEKFNDFTIVGLSLMGHNLNDVSNVFDKNHIDYFKKITKTKLYNFSNDDIIKNQNIILSKFEEMYNNNEVPFVLKETYSY